MGTPHHWEEALEPVLAGFEAHMLQMYAQAKFSNRRQDERKALIVQTWDLFQGG